VRALALSHGWLETPQEGLGEREQTRQKDLELLVRLAEPLPRLAEQLDAFARAHQ
jgi:hypothetical protein